MNPDDYKHVAQLLHVTWPPAWGGASASAAAYEVVRYFPYNAAVAAIEDLQVRTTRPTLKDLIDWAHARSWPRDERYAGSFPLTPMSHREAEEHVYGERYVFEQTTPQGIL